MKVLKIFNLTKPLASSVTTEVFLGELLTRTGSYHASYDTIQDLIFEAGVLEKILLESTVKSYINHCSKWGSIFPVYPSAIAFRVINKLLIWCLAYNMNLMTKTQRFFIHFHY
ncbi:hypothetical protein LNTAR_16583 [Lentisphaera araneosa HTCC2155]|uniref:Uncharacterized protein n=1 Tax=Lentisphaera araneosa HTCC2155 TaxID=313628 RepID=A6DQD1_9BACT|nr:hypothetical protein LNTAR_16583 [Lentisphaera araneosa HTCC2155]